METPLNVSLLPWLDDLLSESPEAAAERARLAFDRDVEAFQNRLVLVGAGNIGRRVLTRLRQDGIQPLAFTDNQSNQWGTSVDGLDVLPPKDAAARYGRNAAFIVTIYNNRHSFPVTRDQLSRLGCLKVISVLPLRWKYHEDFLPYYRDDLPEKVLLQGETIREAYSLWSDEPSRREFVTQVSWRLHGNFDALGKADLGQQYFPKDLIRRTADEFFVDVGAYDGDTIRSFLKTQGDIFRRVLALEPDPQNFQKLVEYLSTLPAVVATRIEARAIAAFNHACRLRFDNGAATSAALNANGSIDVEGARLDDLLEGLHPTYIKMDIEGAELDAIEGCRRVLMQDRPVIAACVYHAQDHLWRIPVLLNQIRPGYAFFLRSYATECWETVCYAVPNERAQ